MNHAKKISYTYSTLAAMRIKGLHPAIFVDAFQYDCGLRPLPDKRIR